MWQVVTPKRFVKALAKCPENVVSRVEELKEKLKKNPYIGEKLVGHKNFYRIRIGDYRLIYQVNKREKLVVLYDIAHRKNVYRFFLLFLSLVLLVYIFLL